MDIDYLRRFVTLAGMKRINFSHAAETLNIPQPHLTQQIQRLERELGVQLFNRRKRPPELTLAGQEFLRETRHVLEHLERAKVLAQRSHRGEIGHLRVGINISVSNSDFPNLILAFRDRFPDVGITLKEMIAADQIVQLIDQKIDVGFFHSYELLAFDNKDKFESQLVLEESLVVVLPERHPLAKQSQIQISELKDEPFILPSTSIDGFRCQIIELCQRSGFFPRMKQEATWTTTTLSLVSCEMGVTILPTHVQNIQRSGVVYRPIQGETPKLGILAVWLKGDESKVLSNFLTVVKPFR
jgi:DNA-binding transcriptional LysR family regulator